VDELNVSHANAQRFQQKGRLPTITATSFTLGVATVDRPFSLAPDGASVLNFSEYKSEGFSLAQTVQDPLNPRLADGRATAVSSTGAPLEFTVLSGDSEVQRDLKAQQRLSEYHALMSSTPAAASAAAAPPAAAVVDEVDDMPPRTIATREGGRPTQRVSAAVGATSGTSDPNSSPLRQTAASNGAAPLDITVVSDGDVAAAVASLSGGDADGTGTGPRPFDGPADRSVADEVPLEFTMLSGDVMSGLSGGASGEASALVSTRGRALVVDEDGDDEL
jgi:hypothetical protein